MKSQKKHVQGGRAADNAAVHCSALRRWARRGRSRGGKGTVQLPYDLKLNSGPIKKAKKRGDSKKKMLRKQQAAEKGENWSERKAVHVAKMSKKIEATKKAKKTWQ